jgi:hypothetical protein
MVRAGLGYLAAADAADAADAARACTLATRKQPLPGRGRGIMAG